MLKRFAFAKAKLQRALLRSGWLVTRLSAEDRRHYLTSFDDSIDMPPGSADLLDVEHPSLVALRDRYANLNLPVTVHSSWSAQTLSEELDLKHFRGDNVYVWQYRRMRSGAADVGMYLTLKYVESRDDLSVLKKSAEDGLFGCWQFRFGDRPAVSRDLLDSANEINFLDREVGISKIDGLRVLDIGAGYGRLAHRMTESLPNLTTNDCVDAIAESTYLCDFYLKFRKIDGKARAIPLDRIGDDLGERYDLAVNIHSFSECRLVAIQWWLKRIAEREIPWLLIVPNTADQLLSDEDGDGGVRRDFTRDVFEAGYDLVRSAPIYDHAETRQLVGIDDHYLLFKRRQ